MGLGELRGVPRRDRQAGTGRRRRQPDRPRHGARLRDGGARRPQRARDPGGHRGDEPVGAARPSRPAHWASRRRARSRTAPWTANRCRGRIAAEDELFALGRAMAAGGAGGVRTGPAGRGGRGHRRARRRNWSGCSASAPRSTARLSFALIQVDADPNLWREQLDISAAAHEAGSRLHPQIAARPFGMLLGFPGHHAFTHRPTYRRLKAECSREELAARLAEPAVRRRSCPKTTCRSTRTKLFDGMFALAQYVDGAGSTTSASRPTTNPPTSDTVATIAARARPGPAGDDVRPDARGRCRRRC